MGRHTDDMTAVVGWFKRNGGSRSVVVLSSP